MGSTRGTLIVVVAVVGMLAGSGLVLLWTTTSHTHAGPAPTSAPSHARTVASITPEPTSTVRAPSMDALEVISSDGRFAVSVLDLDSGAALSYGKGSFDTASIVKVDILAALLYQHQQAGTSMSRTERALATNMIENSDNTAATTLFRMIGAEKGLEDFNEVIGLSDTDVDPHWYWGLTQTTADDQVRMLEVVFGGGSVLTARSRAYVQDLMSHVLESQRIGVSAAADVPDEAVLKSGALQRTDTWRWDVTSIGRIVSDGRTYLVAVLSGGNTTYESGVALIEEVAQAAVSAM